MYTTSKQVHVCMACAHVHSSGTMRTPLLVECFNSSICYFTCVRACVRVRVCVHACVCVCVCVRACVCACLYMYQHSSMPTSTVNRYLFDIYWISNVSQYLSIFAKAITCTFLQ